VKQWLTLFADYYNSELTDQLYRDNLSNCKTYYNRLN